MSTSWTFLGLIIIINIASITQIEGTISGAKISGPSEIFEGATTALVCSADCDPPPCSYVWSDSKRGELAKSATLQLANVLRDETSYKCTVEDGNKTSQGLSYKFDVYYGPDNVELTSGSGEFNENNSTSVVTCNVSSCNPNCTAVWKKANKEIKRHTVTESDISFPLFESSHVITRGDAGNYSCVVTNGYNLSETTSRPYSLTVYYGPDDATINKGNSITKVEGSTLQSLDIACASVAAHPTPSIEWTSTVTNIFTKHETVTTNLKLFTADGILLRGHDGTYTCTVRNTKTNKEIAKTIRIIVHYAPVVEMSWVAETHTLNCTASGNPEDYNFTTSFTHKVEGMSVRHVTLTPTPSTSSAHVLLSNNTYQDTGNYTCQVSNNIINYRNNNKWQEEIKSLQIKDKPVILEHNTTYNVSKGDPLDIVIVYYSLPEVTNKLLVVEAEESNLTGVQNSTISWPVTPDFYSVKVPVTGRKLSIQSQETLEEYFNNYTVVLENEQGSVQVDFVIYPEGPPDIPLKFAEIEHKHDSAKFTATSGFFNGARQTFVIEYRLNNNDSSWSNGSRTPVGVKKDVTKNPEVTNLQPETSYAFRIYAVNIYNRSGYSKEIYITTAEKPVPVALIGGIVGGILAVIIIIAIIIGIIKWRQHQESKSPPPPIVPFSQIDKDLQSEPAYENTALAPSVQSQNIYENTKKNSSFKGKSEENDKIYTNQQPGVEVPPYENNKPLSADSMGYVDLNKKPNVEEAYGDVEVQKAESPYYNAKSQDTSNYMNFEQVPKHGPVKQESVEQDYLEMDVNAAKMGVNPYYNSTEMAGKQHSGETQRETYMSMKTEENKNRESLPNFVAPLPPGVFHQEEDYMNTQFGPRTS